MEPAVGFAPTMPNGNGSAGRLLSYSDTLAIKGITSIFVSFDKILIIILDFFLAFLFTDLFSLI